MLQQTTSQVQGTITILLTDKRLPTVDKLSKFQLEHYTKRLAEATAKEVKNYAEISHLRKEVNQFKALSN